MFAVLLVTPVSYRWPSVLCFTLCWHIDLSLTLLYWYGYGWVYSGVVEKIIWGTPPFPPPSPFPPTLSLPPFPSLPLPSSPSPRSGAPSNPARGLGERCKLAPPVGPEAKPRLSKVLVHSEGL
jgi:hypothetical protein